MHSIQCTDNHIQTVSGHRKRKLKTINHNDWITYSWLFNRLMNGETEMSKLTKCEIRNIELYVSEDLLNYEYYVKPRLGDGVIITPEDDIYPAISLLYMEMRLEQIEENLK